MSLLQDLHEQIISHLSLYSPLSQHLIESRLSHRHIAPVSHVNTQNHAYLVSYLRDLLRYLVDLRHDEQMELRKCHRRARLLDAQDRDEYLNAIYDTNAKLKSILKIRHDCIWKYLRKLLAYREIIYDCDFLDDKVRELQRVQEGAEKGRRGKRSVAKERRRVLKGGRPSEILKRYERRYEVPQYRMSLF